VSKFFAYRGGELHAEDVPVAHIAATVGTPFYLYSSASFVGQYRALAAALVQDPPTKRRGFEDAAAGAKVWRRRRKKPR